MPTKPTQVDSVTTLTFHACTAVAEVTRDVRGTGTWDASTPGTSSRC